MKHFTYILYSSTKDRNYFGSSADVEERLKRHNSGAMPSTKPGRPRVLVYFEEYQEKSEALKHESKLKKMKRP